LKGWSETWSSFPAKHKKRFYQGIAAYVLLVVGVAAWIHFRAHDTVQKWQENIPVATAVVKNVYLTPQIGEAPKPPEPVAPPPTDTAKVPETAQPVKDDGKTYITIIMAGLGKSTLPTERALDDLPPEVTLAFSPYGDNPQGWIKKSVASHHETLMMLPMETEIYPEEDPGPRALSTRLSDHDNEENLNWLLAKSDGVAGVINMMGSRFMTDGKRLSPVFETLRKKDNLFIEVPSIAKSMGATVAAQEKIPYFAATAQIDAIATDRDIRDKLAMLEKTAREHGYAVGIAMPYPLTFNIVKSWAAGLKERGITLAPLETVWKNKPHHEETIASPPQTPPQQP
jgi:polysaccharide deacetylase 2 family uncharacterized protein YibQ